MNRLIRELTRVCAERRLDTKWLLAPSLRLGNQWLERVARGGGVVLNARVRTLAGLARDMAAREVTAQGLTPLSSRQTKFLVARLFEARRTEDGGYFADTALSDSFVEKLHGAIREARLAGVRAADLRDTHFEAAPKGASIRSLLSAYEGELRANKLADYALLLELAVARAADETALLTYPEDLEMTVLERRFVETWPEERRAILAVDQPLDESARRDQTDIAALHWLPDPAAAPAPVEDGTARLYHAVGAANEVREVFRRCLAEGLALDTVEVLHTSKEDYVPLFYELGHRFLDGQSDTETGLAITFAEGVPARYARPGRALMAWLDWIESNYGQSALVRMVREGLLTVPAHGEAPPVPHPDLAAALRALPVGWGAKRYSMVIGQAIARAESTGRDRRALETLDTLVRGILECGGSLSDSAPQLLAAAEKFLERHARSAGEFDQYARRKLIEEITAMRELAEGAEALPGFDPRAWLRALPDTARLAGSGPRPGCLHVDHVRSGGHTGRAHTFILGLGDAHFPGAGLQDPLLLDKERARISTGLQTSTARLRADIEGFARLLARLRGRVTLSFVSSDLADGGERFPSPVLLAVYRILSENRDGSPEDFMRWLGAPCSFAPLDEMACLDEGEWWMWRLCGAEMPGALDAVFARYLDLAAGAGAQRARLSEVFTAYDGHTPDAGAALNPFADGGSAVSASALETLGACPLRYFFKQVLKIEPPEKLEQDLARWLEPLEKGSLMHRVFQRFLAELSGAGLKPEVKRDESRLLEILHEELENARRRMPPPADYLYGAESRELERMARTFLISEAELCQRSTPVYFETSLGLPPEELPTPLDSLEAVALDIGAGCIRAHGRIDRIDRLDGPDPGRFALWDYKTGGANKFDENPPFNQGRVIQNALYVAMAEVSLKAKFGPGARVASFGYFFPSEQGEGRRIAWTPGQLAEGRGIIARLCAIIAAGAFAPTDCKEDCEHCDFKDTCGDINAITNASKQKIDSALNDALRPMRELRR